MTIFATVLTFVGVFWVVAAIGSAIQDTYFSDKKEEPSE